MSLQKSITFLAIIFLTLIFSSQKLLAQKHQSYHLKTVVIDAGHGGKDPGAIGKNSREKDIVLKIALKLGEYINKYLPDVKIVYTRKTDVFIPLKKRPEIANNHKADLFISIHANSNRNKRIIGTESYTLGLHKTKENLEVAMKENSVILYEEDYSTKYEGFDPENPASYIIFNLLQGANRDKSISLAELTEKQFKTRVGRHSRGVREAGFWVLKQASMPSVLIEVGFISNPTEEKFLKSKKGQVYLASAIFRAFRDYKKQIEGNSTVLNKTKSPQKQINKTQKTLRSTHHQVKYCVQIQSSLHKISLKSKIFKGFKNIDERKIGNRYKYYVGCTSNYNEILKEQRIARQKIKNSFVVAFYKGKRISVSKARKLQKT